MHKSIANARTRKAHEEIERYILQISDAVHLREKIEAALKFEGHPDPAIRALRHAEAMARALQLVAETIPPGQPGGGE